MQTKVASIAVAVGTKHWPSPWAYMLEAGSFPTALIDGGRAVSDAIVGQGRGVNVHIPAIPDLPEEWEFVPGVSRIFVMHRRARSEWAEPPVDFLPRLAVLDWAGKAEAETFAMLTYRDAASLLEQDLPLPDPPVIIEPDGEVFVLDDAPASAPSFADQPFLAWRVHHLLLAAVDANMVQAKFFPGGVIGWVWMAQRPFVQYTRDPKKAPPDDPRVTLALISNDSEQWNDPTGRTVYHA
jgi:hypothetical protein